MEIPFGAELKAQAPARYWSILFAPEAKRADLAALHAFDLAISRIPSLVSEPALGEIRLQWWREVINGARAEEGLGHPLAAALTDAITRNSLPLTAFERYFDAAVFAFYHDAFPDRQAFEAWGGATSSALLQLCALCLAPDHAPQAADACGHGGLAVAVAQCLADMPRTRARGQCFVPQDILAACGLDRERFVSATEPAVLKPATDAFAALGQEHLNRFTLAARTMPQTARPAILPVFAAGGVLAKAVRRSVNPAVDDVKPSALSLLWRTCAGALR